MYQLFMTTVYFHELMQAEREADARRERMAAAANAAVRAARQPGSARKALLPRLATTLGLL